jgi:hypothetical protein
MAGIEIRVDCPRYACVGICVADKWIIKRADNYGVATFTINIEKTEKVMVRVRKLGILPFEELRLVNPDETEHVVTCHPVRDEILFGGNVVWIEC